MGRGALSALSRTVCVGFLGRCGREREACWRGGGLRLWFLRVLLRQGWEGIMSEIEWVFGLKLLESWSSGY